ncbi:DUF2256 domain-containing protein [Tautonia marina]|uniref:DUF2256 domain-containing protein n=1 Tax=Tautonia marina TaxID=2653855 RepID=UPI001260CCCB|nr:DUF2256 domain-containing protein [Tautonia marina]
MPDRPRKRDRAEKPGESKVCPVCQRPFSNRRKWRDCWEQVVYCSERCRRSGRAEQGSRVQDSSP